MSEDDKEVFAKGRPYIVGLVALAFSLRWGWTHKETFKVAEKFVKEFERVNGITEEE